VVHILVAMNEPKNLDKQNDILGYPCLGVSVTVKLKGYDFFFRREPHDFVPDENFTPYFWKRKGDDDAGFDGPGQDNTGNDAPNSGATLMSASMDVDKPQGDNSMSHGKTVSMGPVERSTFAMTPINPNPTTPRGKEIVEVVRSTSPWLLKGASSPGHCMVQRPSPSTARLQPGATALDRQASPAGDGRAASPPSSLGRSPRSAAWAVASSSPLSMARAESGLLPTPDEAHAGTLQAMDPSEVKEVGAGCAAAHAEGAASLAEDHGTGMAMPGGGSCTIIAPLRFDCAFGCAWDNIFFGITVPSGRGAFLVGCGVLYNTDISSPGSFIVSTTSFVRQVYFSITTTTFYAMCAYGEA
jgi:hypothetical protein